jgi:hypothetical protein
MVIATLIIRNMDIILIMITTLWSMLPPNDVLMLYAACGALSIFAIYLLNHVVIQRMPINMDVIIKNNRYFEINRYTATSFCIAVISAVIYYTYFYDGVNGSGSGSGNRILDAVAAASKYNIGIMHVIMYVVILIALIQMYYVMLWSITNTSITKM